MKPKRRTLMFALTTLMGIAVALLILLCLDLTLQFLRPVSPYGPYKISGSVPIPSKSEFSALHIPVHAPPALKQKRLRTERTPGTQVTWPDGYFVWDPYIGARPSPNGHFEASMSLPDGREAYHITYNTDAEGRRKIPNQGAARNKNLIFLGDSFTYGEGVEDEQTLPAQVAAGQNQFRVSNYSFHGWGPGNILRRLSLENFGQDLAKSPGGRAIYVFIDHHIARVTGSLNVYRQVSDWTQHLPYYSLDAEGHLQTAGMIRDHRGWLDPVFVLLSHSQILNYLNVDLPLPSEEHLKLVAAMVAEMRDILNRKLNTMNFTMVFYPGTTASHWLKPFLDAQGISTLDYSNLYLEKYLEVPAILPDGHPSAAADEFLAKQIISDLNLKQTGQ